MTRKNTMIKHTELSTIRDFIRYATSSFNQAGLFYGHGTDNAWDEAVGLVLHTVHLKHDVDPAVLDAALTQPEREQLFTLIEKRVEQRIPLPYLINEAWFFNLPFYVDERVLIPRSPIAELIAEQFQPWVEAENVRDILDLCTGSACIAIACAKAFPQAAVDAVDISADALTVANINILKHHVEDQVTLYESDLFAALENKQYDIIVSNPPYVSLEEMAALPQEYRHEPELGLTAGELGLDFAKRILAQALTHLKPQGILVMEVGNSEFALQDAFPQIPFTWLEFENDSGGVFLLTAEQLKAHQADFTL